jgi:hypothetical protein
MAETGLWLAEKLGDEHPPAMLSRAAGWPGEANSYQLPATS